jgi:hypothetical protein
MHNKEIVAFCKNHCKIICQECNSHESCRKVAENLENNITRKIDQILKLSIDNAIFIANMLENYHEMNSNNFANNKQDINDFITGKEEVVKHWKKTIKIFKRRK